MKSSRKNRNTFSLVILLSLILSALALTIPWQKAQMQQNPVPLSEIYKILNSPNSTPVRRSQLLIDQVKKRGVTFSLTSEIEKELRNGGATVELIEAIRQNMPKATVSDYLKSGDDFRKKGDCGSAVAEYTKGINSNPQPAAFYGRGLCYLMQMDYSRASTDFKDAVRLDNKQADAFFYLGISFDYQGDFPNASKNYQESINLKADVRSQSVLKCLTASSVDGCASVINSAPDFISLFYYKRGNAYLSRRDFDNAIKDYRTAHELSSKFMAAQNNISEAYNLRGVSFFTQNDFAQAVTNFTEAIKHRPENFPPYANRCAAYLRQGNYEAAIKDCEKVISLEPQYANAYHFRALAYEKQRNYKQAVADFEKVLNLDPKNIFARSSWLRLNYNMPMSNFDPGTTEWEDSRVKSKFYIKRDEKGLKEIRVHFDDLRKYATPNKYLVLWILRQDARSLKIGQLFNTGERKEGDIKYPDKDTEVNDLPALGLSPMALFVTVEDGNVEQPTTNPPFSIYNASSSRSDSANPGSPTMKKQP